MTDRAEADRAYSEEYRERNRAKVAAYKKEWYQRRKTTVRDWMVFTPLGVTGGFIQRRVVAATNADDACKLSGLPPDGLGALILPTHAEYEQALAEEQGPATAKSMDLFHTADELVPA